MIKFYERIDSGKLRSLCIINEWCTEMDTEVYDAMLCNETFFTRRGSVRNDVLELAYLIARHSDTEMGVANIAGTIFREAVIRWCEEQEDGEH